MIEVAVAIAACTILAGLLYWYDRPTKSDWDALLSPEAEEIETFLQAKFDAEGRAMDWSLRRAVAEMDRTEGLRLLAAAGAYITGLVPERLALLRRLKLYSRLAGAISPQPRRCRPAIMTRLRSSKREPDAAQLTRTREELRTLEAGMIEGWRLLVASVRKE